MALKLIAQIPTVGNSTVRGPAIDGTKTYKVLVRKDAFTTDLADPTDQQLITAFQVDRVRIEIAAAAKVESGGVKHASVWIEDVDLDSVDLPEEKREIVLDEFNKILADRCSHLGGYQMRLGEDSNVHVSGGASVPPDEIYKQCQSISNAMLEHEYAIAAART